MVTCFSNVWACWPVSGGVEFAAHRKGAPSSEIAAVAILNFKKLIIRSSYHASLLRRKPSLCISRARKIEKGITQRENLRIAEAINLSGQFRRDSTQPPPQLAENQFARLLPAFLPALLPALLQSFPNALLDP